jgi:hypothetical protein
VLVLKKIIESNKNLKKDDNIPAFL